MKIERAWAMPNSDTFSIKPIKDLISKEFSGLNFSSKFNTVKACDPFVRNSPFKKFCVSNDLDETIKADYHLDALDFLRGLKKAHFDIVLFDPPYSPRQISECYKKMEKSVNMQTTQASFWGNIKKEISRIVKPGGKVITCGWNSGGIGKSQGFEIEKILLVAHGGWHNDTIVTVETKKTVSR